ncbi:MAG: helix-turn-helix domain-containing protein [Clostridiales bacterium]|jgi:AraC-like DNA-binding protein|nr:helix-turn-helix domain-containing protein [Clostridiales bacterium]
MNESRSYVFYEGVADDDDYFYFRLRRDDRTPGHFHNSMEIFFVKDGSSAVTVNGAERLLTKGEIAVSYSLDVHSYCARDSSETYAILLGQKYCARFLDAYKGRLDSFLPVCGGTEKIFGLLERFDRERADFNKLMLRGFADYLLGVLARYYPIRPAVRNKKNELLIDVLSYINENFTRDITLKILAKQFGYAPGYFSSLFNTYVGMHLKDYINRLRVGKVNLLTAQNADITLTAAIMQSGFLSAESYYRAKRRFGGTKNR